MGVSSLSIRRGNPYVNLVLDKDGDLDTVDREDMEGIGTAPTAPPITDDTWEEMKPTDQFYDSDGSTMTAYDGTLATIFTVSEWQAALPNAVVTRVRIIFGIWGTTGQTVFIDDAMIMGVTYELEPKIVVPDPGFETKNEVTGLHSFYVTDSGCIAEITSDEKYTGRKSAHLSIPATAWKYATVKTDISPGSTKPSNVWFDNIVTPPTFMYKLTEGSHSPYWVFKIKIVGGPYDGQWLVLISWQLDGLTTNGWTLYNNDDWHYIVEDWDTYTEILNDFTDGGGWHHTLAEVQAMFDGTLETVQVSIGLWSFAEVTEVYVDEMRVMA